MRTILGLWFFVLSSTSFALPELPGNLQCLDSNQEPMSYNNEQVVRWEQTTQDQFHNRGLVEGTVSNIYPNKTGHTHFAIQIDNPTVKNDAGIEVIYNDEFGELPRLNIGMKIVACGDYITVGRNARLPSPMPAILHWVHYNPGDRDGGKHPDGFLIIDGKVYGMAPATSHQPISMQSF